MIRLQRVVVVVAQLAHAVPSGFDLLEFDKELL